MIRKTPRPEPLFIPFPLPDGAILREWKFGAIYAIGHLGDDQRIGPPFKVGRVGPGGVVNSRMINIQIGAHSKLAVAIIQPVRFSSVGIEGLAHIALANRRMRGEWFNCSVERIRQVLEAALKYERDPLPKKIIGSRAVLRCIRLIVRSREKSAIIEWEHIVR